MKILLFGKHGQVGWELRRSLLPLGEITVCDIEDVDFTKPDSLRKIVRQNGPDLIVNAVAYTAVDQAEEEEELAYLVNAVAAGVLAEEAERAGALLIHYSTDYIFDGRNEDGYVENDEPNPLNAYGRTKLKGEQLVRSTACDHLILRTSWVYASRGANFLLTMLRLAKEREEISIVNDQFGSPTWANHIANTTAYVAYHAQRERQHGEFESDLYHLTSRGKTTWYEFAVKMFQEARGLGLGDDFILSKTSPITTDAYPTAAIRPKYSYLKCDSLESKYGLQMPDWSTSLSLCLESFR